MGSHWEHQSSPAARLGTDFSNMIIIMVPMFWVGVAEALSTPGSGMNAAHTPLLNPPTQLNVMISCLLVLSKFDD